MPQIQINYDYEVDKEAVTEMYEELSEDESSEETNSMSLSRSSSASALNDVDDLDIHSSVKQPLSSLASAFSSSASLGSLRIPSHQTFHKFIHQHEVPRKVLHLSIGFITLWLYTIGVSVSQVTPVLVTMFVVIGGTDLIRFRCPEFNQTYIKCLGFLMREKEVNGYNGVIWYLLGLVLVFVAFPKDISMLSVLLLSWADTAASTIGRAYGKYTPKVGSKSLAGSAAAFVASAFSAWLFYQVFVPLYSYHNRPGDILYLPETSAVPFWVVCLATGFIGAVSEAIDIIDDNFSIPVLSAVFMLGFLKLTSTGSYQSEVFA
jgi:diacylglycerol kinase (CTP)